MSYKEIMTINPAVYSCLVGMCVYEWRERKWDRWPMAKLWCKNNSYFLAPWKKLWLQYGDTEKIWVINGYISLMVKLEIISTDFFFHLNALYHHERLKIKTFAETCLFNL